MGSTPTFWDWLQFFISLALSAYALIIFIGDRLPGMAKVNEILRRTFLIFIDTVGGWLLDFYMGIARGIWWVLVMIWRGPSDSVNDFSQNNQPYVTSLPTATNQNAQTKPKSVCLSANPIPEQPPIPPAIAALILDTQMTKESRRSATSKESLVCALIAAGWGYSEIRDVVKANNNTFPAEFEAARKRLEQPTTATTTTPIAGREVPMGVEFNQS